MLNNFLATSGRDSYSSIPIFSAPIFSARYLSNNFQFIIWYFQRATKIYSANVKIFGLPDAKFWYFLAFSIFSSDIFSPSWKYWNLSVLGLGRVGQNFSFFWFFQIKSRKYDFLKNFYFSLITRFHVFHVF
jgi:hypothetical protein